MLRKITFAPEEYYHLYNRGVDKRIIFKNDSDYERFMVLLYVCNGEISVQVRNFLSQGRSLGEIYNEEIGKSLVNIGAYCLMPNHFHLLVKERVEGGISTFMKKVSTAYSMYFNVKYKRSGALFQGRFKAEHVNNDVYLKYLYSYIHLNPVKLIEPKWKEEGITDTKRAKQYLKDFKYSSYQDYLGLTRTEESILSSKAFPEYFESVIDFEECTDDMLTYKQNNIRKGPSLAVV